jgi:transcriptional regulator with XRE-family HTH domain
MERSERNELGYMLKERRSTMGLTLGELATKAGVSASHLGRIERSERFPSAQILRRLAKPLGFGEPEVLALGGYLSRDQAKAPPEVVGTQLDPYVARVLSQESVEVKRYLVSFLYILKGMARSLLQGPNGRSEEKKGTA